MKSNLETMTQYAKEFDDICQKDKIWYALDSYSTLAVICGYENYFTKKFGVIMTIDSYRIIRRNYRDRVIDSFTNPQHLSLKSLFVTDAKKWKFGDVQIEISIIVPSSIKNALAFKTGPADIKSIYRKKIDNIKHAIDELNCQKFEGYFIISDRKEPLNHCWLQVCSFKTQLKSILNHQFPIIKEYNQLLIENFGNNFMDKNIFEQKLSFGRE